MNSIARNFSLGVEITEGALNKVSAVLYEEKPELFETSEDILVEPSTGRKLGLYAMLSKPFTFNLHPVENSPLGEGDLYAEAKLSFSLTDKKADNEFDSIITRIKMRLVAALVIQGDISVGNQSIEVYLRDFDFIEFEGDHPNGLALEPPKTSSALVSTADTNLHSTDPSFVALLNYLIEVFLKKALAEPLEEFPFPPLNLVVDTDVNLYLRGVTTWGNTLGAYLDLAAGSYRKPVGNVPARQADIGIGVTEGLVTSVLHATLPLRFDLEPTPDDQLLSIKGGSWIMIRDRPGLFRSSIDLNAPDRVRATFYFEGQINAQVNVPLGKYWVRVGLPIPMGRGSYISGSFSAFVKDEGDKFELWFRAGHRFFSDIGAIRVFTDYRSLIRNAVRDWLRRHVSPILKKIPILGWIISKGVEVIVSELIGNFIGVPLDIAASIILSLLLTSLYNALRIGWNEKIEFCAIKVKKLAFGKNVPVAIKSLRSSGIVGNQGGELILLGDLQNPQSSIPQPPEPTPPEVFLDQLDGTPDATPSTPPDDFLPKYITSAPNWQIGALNVYKLLVKFNGQVFTGAQEVFVSQLTDDSHYDLNISTTGALSAESSTDTIVRVDSTDGRILYEQQTIQDESMTIVTELTYDYYVGIAKSSIRFGDLPEIIQEIELPDATVVSTAQMVFQLQRTLDAASTGKLARLDFDDQTNLAVFVPVDIVVSDVLQEVIQGRPTDVYDVTLTDNEFSTTFKIRVDDPNEIFSIVQEGGGVELSATLELPPQT